MAHSFRTDLDHSIPQAGQRPVSNGCWQDQCAKEEATCIAFRKHTLLPLDDCLYALQATIPNLTRSSLHRLFQRHGISRLPDLRDEAEPKKKFKSYPIGYFHIDIAEVRTEEGKLHMFVAIDRTSKFAFVELRDRATRAIASQFLRNLADAVTMHADIGLSSNAKCNVFKQTSI